MAGKNGIPIIFEEYFLCKEFGWTPEELKNQSATKIAKFLKIIEIINEK